MILTSRDVRYSLRRQQNGRETKKIEKKARFMNSHITVNKWTELQGWPENSMKRLKGNKLTESS